MHGLHHKYNMGEGRELSPWASIAFNPLDGILQVLVQRRNDGSRGKKKYSFSIFFYYFPPFN